MANQGRLHLYNCACFDRKRRRRVNPEAMLFFLCFAMTFALPNSVSQNISGSAQTSMCIAEEGTVHELRCNFTSDDQPGLSNWTFTVVKDNMTVTIEHCLSDVYSSKDVCFNSGQIGNNHIGAVNIKYVSRTNPFNMETRWACAFGHSTITQDMCALFHIISRAKNPVCGDPILDLSKKEVRVTCSTERVYPRAVCEVFHSQDQVTFEPTPGETVYSHTIKKEGPVYFQTECTRAIPLCFLGNGKNYFKVRMYPELTGSTHFFTESETQFIQIKIRLETSSTDSTSSDGRLPVVLGVLLALVSLTAIVLAVFVIRYRQIIHGRQALLKKKGTIRVYDEIDNGKKDGHLYDNVAEAGYEMIDTGKNQAKILHLPGPDEYITLTDEKQQQNQDK